MRKIILLFLITTIFCLFSGCLFYFPSKPSPTPSTSTSYSCTRLYIVSNCQSCEGKILINDCDTGYTLMPWGAILITNLNINCGDIIRVNLQDTTGHISHTEPRTATYPQTIVTFDWFTSVR